MRSACLRFAAVCAVVLFTACGGGDPTEPPDAAIVGSYAATTLRVTPASAAPIDVLAAGGSLALTIDAQHQVTGTLHVPPSIDGGLDATMTGTVSITGSAVRFNQSTDTFVRDLTFQIGAGKLTADQTLVSGTRYEVVLTRQ